MADGGCAPPQPSTSRPVYHAPGFYGPDRDKRQEQSEEDIGSVVLELEAIVRQLRADPAHHHENCGSNAAHPSLAHHRSGPDSRDPEKQRHQTHRRFPGSEQRHGRTLENQPSERRALSEPQPSRKIRHGAIAQIERDHLLVNPQRKSGTPLINIDGNTNEGYRECRAGDVEGVQHMTVLRGRQIPAPPARPFSLERVAPVG